MTLIFIKYYPDHDPEQESLAIDRILWVMLMPAILQLVNLSKNT